MYVLHYCVDNASLAVRLALEELDQPYSDRLLDRDAGEPDQPFYRALHPYGLVPALETPDGPIFETAAILLWLADRHGALAPEAASPERAAFLKWFFFVTSNLHPAIFQMFYPERFAGLSEAEEAFSAGARDRAIRAFATLEDLAATRPGWFAPDSPSILSIYVAMFYRWAQSFPANGPRGIDLSPYSALRAMMLAHEARPAAQRTAAREGLGDTIFTSPDY